MERIKGLPIDHDGTRRSLAIQLYAQDRLSLGKAATMAGMPIFDFWSLLVDRGVPVFYYTEEDYEADRDTVRRILGKEAQAWPSPTPTPLDRS